MPHYDFNQGFGRAHQYNQELVGGTYPAEQNDWGFGDDTSFTQLRTKNGLLEWIDLARGGQRIMFTDLRDMKRYVLEDPPSNKLVEVPSPGRQDPDTGQPEGEPVFKPPVATVPGPEPPPAQPESKPPVTNPGTSFEGLEQINVADFGRDADAISRAIDKASGRQVWLLFVGGFADRRGRQFPPNVRLRMVSGLVARTGDREGVLWTVRNDCRDLSLDDGMTFGPYGQIPTALEVGAPGITIDGLIVKNHLGMGFTVNDANVTLRNLAIYGPGGTGCVGDRYGQASWGAMWSGRDASGLHIDGLYATGEGGGCVFVDCDGFLIENVKGDANCLGFTRDMNNPEQMYGGGQVCCGPNSRNGIIRNADIWSNGSKWASGFELDGGTTKLIDCKAHGHTPAHGFVLQRGAGHELQRCEAYKNRVGCGVMPEASDYLIKSCNFHDNIDADLEDNGKNRRS